MTRLERRVAALERQMRLQIRLNAITSARITNASARIDLIADRDLETSSAIGTSALITPRTLGYVSASCISGAMVGGGFVADYPVELGY